MLDHQKSISVQIVSLGQIIGFVPNLMHIMFSFNLEINTLKNSPVIWIIKVTVLYRCSIYLIAQTKIIFVFSLSLFLKQYFGKFSTENVRQTGFHCSICLEQAIKHLCRHITHIITAEFGKNRLVFLWKKMKR